MKIAKKVLAVIMAVAMIAALSAIAFAADGASLVLETAGLEDDTIAVTIVAKNGAGLETIDVNIKYDNTALTVKKAVTYGEFKDAYEKQFGETVLAAANTAIAADAVKVNVGFQEHLYSNDEYAALVKDYEVENAIAVDAAKVEIATVKFAVKEGTKAENVTFELIDNATGEKINTLTVTLVAPTDPVAPTKEETTTKKVEPTTEKVTEKNANTGDQKTGDNMALAAAAGVVVLAGAAFIISKKRK